MFMSIIHLELIIVYDKRSRFIFYVCGGFLLLFLLISPFPALILLNWRLFATITQLLIFLFQVAKSPMSNYFLFLAHFCERESILIGHNSWRGPPWPACGTELHFHNGLQLPLPPVAEWAAAGGFC